MSVNGLGHVSRAHITSRREKSAPLKFQSNRIHNVHVKRDQQTDRALIPTAKNKTLVPHYQARRPLPQRENTNRHAPQSRRSKAHRAPNIHRIPEHIEREALNTRVHENAEIIAQERARDTERPGRGHDEGLPGGEERDGDEHVERSGEDARLRLF